MNISLDSALGRQRRLNQVGETINSIAVPSAAYSLRSLTGGDPLAVRVRREVTAASPLESEKDFTVSEVSSGALVNFINSTVFTRTDELALDAGAGFVGIGESIKCIIGTRYKVTFELKQNSGGSGTVSGNPRFRTSSTFAYSNVVKSSNITESTNRFEVNAATTAYQSYSIEFTVDSGTAANKSFTFQNSDSDDGYTARNINIEVVAGNGFISTWYDQSGNSNDVVQTTAGNQPKIVGSGALLSDGITFDGTDDELATASGAVITASNSGSFSAFSVQTIATGEDGYMYGNASQSPSKGASFYARSEPDFVLSDRTSINNEDRISRSAGQNLLSCVYKSSRANFLVNGSGTTTTEGSYDFDAGSLLFVIGNRNGGTSAGTFLSCSFQEIIIYNNDQTDNRTALETNINSHYSIF
jgi:hypothetical protein